jgi:CBS domain-containing protein
MSSRKIGSVLVVNSSNRLEGIFTDRDFLLKVAATGLPMKSTALGEVMTPSPRSVLENSSVALALNLMFEGGFRHIPIVNQQETLSGVLSLRDFLSFLNQTLMQDLAD